VFAAVVFFVPLNAGVFIVRTLDGDAAAGAYGLANQAATGFYALAVLGVQVVQPHITGVYGLDRSFLRKLALFSLVFFGGLGLLAGVGATLIIRGLLDPAYRPAVPLMVFLMGCAAMLLVANVAHGYLLRFHDERVILVIHACAAATYLGGGTLLVISLGPSAAAVWAAVTALGAATTGVARVRKRWPAAVRSTAPAGES
jgi:O-antigen/teichoic acid export membrane protein